MRVYKDHYYKGYLIHRPEGARYWNIYRPDGKGSWDILFSIGYAETLEEARGTVEVDIMEEEK